MIPLLVVDDIVPSPTLGYGYPRAFQNLTLMHDVGFKPTLFPLRDPFRHTDNDNPLIASGVQIFRPQHSGKHSLEELSTLAKKFPACWVSRTGNYRMVNRALRSGNPNILIVHDVEALSSLRQTQIACLEGQNSSMECIKEEITSIACADIHVSVSQYEANLLEQYGINVAAIIGHVHDYTETSADFANRRNLLHVGGFYQAECPNRDGIRYLVEDILPLVCQEIPGAQLDIVGFNSESVYDICANSPCAKHIHIHGAQPDLSLWYERARVVVIPTRIAAGIAYKATEAIAYATPLVVTPLISQQVMPSFELFYSGASPDKFADIVIDLYKNEELWNNYRSSLLSFRSNRFSKAAATEEMSRVFYTVSSKLAIGNVL